MDNSQYFSGGDGRVEVALETQHPDTDAQIIKSLQTMRPMWHALWFATMPDDEYRRRVYSIAQTLGIPLEL